MKKIRKMLSKKLGNLSKKMLIFFAPKIFNSVFSMVRVGTSFKCALVIFLCKWACHKQKEWLEYIKK